MVALYRNTAHDLQTLEVVGDLGQSVQIVATDEHPFYVVDVGWTTADAVQVGQKLVGAGGAVLTVVANRDWKPDGGVVVYNFQVEGDHTYFVGDIHAQGEWVWTHNMCAARTAGRALSTAENADLLGKNLAREGRGTSIGEAAGHIVASTGSQRQWAAAARSREILAKYSIGINDAANGVPIGTPRPHNTMHTRAFNEMVESRLNSVIGVMTGLYGHGAIRTALRRELRAIGREILGGR